MGTAMIKKQDYQMQKRKELLYSTFNNCVEGQLLADAA